jgi:hypothetical protein
MDFYPFSDDYAILEIELNKVDSKIDLPDVEIVKEVTDDDNYSNSSLAKTASFVVKIALKSRFYGSFLIKNRLYKPFFSGIICR